MCRDDTSPKCRRHFQLSQQSPIKTCHSPAVPQESRQKFYRHSFLLSHTLVFPTAGPSTKQKCSLIEVNEHIISMESGDERIAWMGNYFPCIGNRVLHSLNGDTCCKPAIHLISHGNHKDGSTMLCQYLETVVDEHLKKLLPVDATVDKKFRASFFRGIC
jgi:hypothetical protein